MSASKFKARVTLEDDGIGELQVWDDELTPFVADRRSVREWVAEHLYAVGAEGLRELLKLPKEGNFEAIFDGEIDGTYHAYTGEYDEWLEVGDVRFQNIPASWYDAVRPLELKPSPPADPPA